MNLEQRFKKETGFDAYKDNDLEPKIPLGYYVEWLEEQLILSGVVGQSEQLADDKNYQPCDGCNTSCKEWEIFFCKKLG